MTYFVAKPGKAAPWRSLQAILQEQHKAARAHIDELIKQREALGIPLDNFTDWRGEVSKILADMPSAPRDEAQAMLRKALAVTGRGFQRLAPYEPNPLMAGVEVKLRALSKADVLEMQADMAGVSYAGDDEGRMYRASAAALNVMRPFVAKAIAGIRGAPVGDGSEMVEIEDVNPLPAEVLDALDAAGFMESLFLAAREWQSLDPLGRARFGLSPASISQTSTAPDARLPGDLSSAVRAAVNDHTSQQIQSEKPASALAVTSATTRSSEVHSTSTASAGVSLG